ncbi:MULTISPECIES: hypothetical protein [Modestobacter]|jgi:hypothetical protein|uniref:hypothetical protein n=1 Tax=Modestobacter TaxID=88138 RepID=UPI0012E080D9|nr:MULTISPECIES: hypothetical protein [Modestobacter]
MPPTMGEAAHAAASPLAPFEFDRQPVGPEDVRIDIATRDAGFRFVIDNPSLSQASA